MEILFSRLRVHSRPDGSLDSRRVVGAKYRANYWRPPRCGWGLPPDLEAVGPDAVLGVLGDASLQSYEKLVLVADRERQEPARISCAAGALAIIERLHWSGYDGDGPEDLCNWMRSRSGAYPACVQLGIPWESSAIHFQGAQDRS